MKLINKTKNGYLHTIGDKTYLIPAGAKVEVPEDVAQIWLKIAGIEKYIEPIEAEKEQEKAAKEIEELKAEIEKLKNDNKKLKEKQKK